VIVEAFDQAQMKQMLIQTVGIQCPHIPLVSGSGMAGWGKSNMLSMQDYGNLYICGDQCSGVDETHPPLAPRVGIVAHMQANQVLEILLKGFEFKNVT
jgi:sulfur carrier protein ThiS adenylyltransferase